MASIPTPIAIVIADVAKFIGDNEIDDVDDIIPFIEENYDNIKKYSAYNDLSFQIGKDTVFSYDNYGDEDSDDLFIETDEEYIPIALGTCLRYEDTIYCIDYDLKHSSINNYAGVRVFTTSEKLHPDPVFHTGKRAFYHHRGKNTVGMRGFEEGYGIEDVKAREDVSGPRTLYQLQEISQNTIIDLLLRNSK